MHVDDQGHAVLWFGEFPAEKIYHMPERTAGIRLAIEGRKKPITTEPVDSDDLIGLHSVKKVGRNGEGFGSVTYRLYHGLKLVYHVEHLPQKESFKWQQRANSLRLQGLGLVPCGVRVG